MRSNESVSVSELVPNLTHSVCHAELTVNDHICDLPPNPSCLFCDPPCSIYEKIGRGKHSTVYKGRKKKSIQYYAIKSVEKTQKNRVLQEVREMRGKGVMTTAMLGDSTISGLCPRA